MICQDQVKEQEVENGFTSVYQVALETFTIGRKLAHYITAISVVNHWEGQNMLLHQKTINSVEVKEESGVHTVGICVTTV